MASGIDRGEGKAETEARSDNVLTGQHSLKRPQPRKIRKDGWTLVRRRKFMETLAATANVSEAARVAGKNVSSAYFHRRRDPAFAREWAEALSIGYAELEALLLRQALFGTESVETIENEEGVVKSRKVKRGHPNSIGVRLLLAHRQTVDAVRDVEMAGRPDGEDAIARLRRALELVRARTGKKAGTGDGEEV